MKRILIALSLVVFLIHGNAQAPDAFNYQAILRNVDGSVKVNETISLQISIVDELGASAYLEIHNTKTNESGLVNVVIGEGTTSDDLSAVDWTNGPFFLDIIVNGVHLGSSQLLSMPYALHAKTAETLTAAATYQIGDFAQGGIVFWVDETGQHGLVCAKTDQSTGVRWYAGTNGNSQAKGDGPFAGEANTLIIVAAQVAIGDDGSTYAARICNELKVTEGGKTYGDWYLPSFEELDLMFQNKSNIDATAIANGGSAFADVPYSSSTEHDYSRAFFQNFIDGYRFSTSKHSAGRVRAVRSF